MGLWERLLPILEHNREDLQIQTVWMVLVCCQNNPEAAQALLTKHSILSRLFDLCDGASVELSRKLVSAFSSIIQSAEGGYDRFVQQKGLDQLAHFLERFPEDENLRARIIHTLTFYCKLHGTVPESLQNHAQIYPLLDLDDLEASDPEQYDVVCD